MSTSGAELRISGWELNAERFGGVRTSMPDISRASGLVVLSNRHTAAVTQWALERTNQFLRSVDYRLQTKENTRTVVDQVMSGIAAFVPTPPGKTTLGVAATVDRPDLVRHNRLISKEVWYMCECQEILAARRKRIVLEFAQSIGSVSKACVEFQVPRPSFY